VGPSTHRDRWLRFGFALTVIGLMWVTAMFIAFPGAEGWGYDLRAYLDAAGRLATSGSLYQPETLDGPYRPGPYGLYMYAPPLGVAVAPMTAMVVDHATTLWFALHVTALALACALMPVRLGVRLAVFGVASLSFAVTRDLLLGNVSVLLLLPLAASWRWLDRPAGSVAQAVAMSIRPMLGVLLIWQLLRRQWRAVLWTIATGLVLILLTLPLVGVRGYIDYLTVLRNLTAVSGVEFNYDVSSTAMLLGVSDQIASLALLAGYALAVAAILLSLRRDREVGFMVTITASLLLSPLLWDHYLAMLVLPAAFLAERGRAWALLLPLATWLPPVTYPILLIIASFLPFLAPEMRPTRGTRITPPVAVQGPVGLPHSAGSV
jgi:hypothetical protein